MMYAIMAVAFIGMVIGLQKEKGGAAWGRPMAILCILIALGAAGVTMFGGGGGSSKAADINTKYQMIKGEVIGNELAKNFAGKRVLFLLPPETPVASGQTGDLPYKAVLGSLKKALSGAQIVAEVEPKMPADIKAKVQAQMQAGGEDMGMMEGQMWFNVAALNKELAPYKGQFDLIVCLTGLPGVETGDMAMMAPGVRQEPYTKLDIWTDANVKIALVEGGINRLGKGINDGKIVAAVTYKQQIASDAWDKQPPSDLKAAFDMRFVLITPQNVREHMSYFTR